MRNIKSTDKFKIWEINDREGYAEVRMSESRKIREDNSYDMSQVQNGVAQNGYIGTNWRFIRFVRHAYNKLKEISVGDTITNLSMEISREPYYGDVNAELNAAIDLLEKRNVIAQNSVPKLQKVYGVVYPKNERITVFSFETAEEAEAKKAQQQQQQQNNTNIDKGPQVAPTPQPVQPQYQQAPIQPQYQQVPVQPTTTAPQPIPVAPTPMNNAANECPF